MSTYDQGPRPGSGTAQMFRGEEVLRPTTKKEENAFTLVAETVLKIVKARGPQYIHYRGNQYHSVTEDRRGSDRCLANPDSVLGFYDESATLQHIVEDCREAFLTQNLNPRIKLR